MNRTRIVFLLRYWILLVAVGPACSGFAQDLRTSEGKFIRLTTDLRSADEADSLVASFDAAVPQWIEFWNLPTGALADWKVDACVIQDRTVFQREGLLPPQVPDFPFGYALGNRVWILAQQSEYYTRHLLLHEGVHSLAFHHFDGAGPTWFMEGTAELLATHSGQGKTTQINQIPGRREKVPYWGRFKRMNQLRDQGEIPTLETVMRYQPNLLGEVESYSWSWAAVMLLHAYPEYHEAFFAAAKKGSDRSPNFNRQLYRDLREQWPVIAAQWRLMCQDLDYGFDWSNQRVELSTSDPEWDGHPFQVKVLANRGWQSIGPRLPPQSKITLTPSGWITVANSEKPWTSQASGITIEYRQGRPLGQLLMCVIPNAGDAQAKRLSPLEIRSLTEPTTIEVPEFSWLLLRVNDGVDELADNTGGFEVELIASP